MSETREQAVERILRDKLGDPGFIRGIDQSIGLACYDAGVASVSADRDRDERESRVRAWSDCPLCEGKGIHEYFEGIEFSGNETYFSGPCPTCLAFYRDRDAAVNEEREACALVLETNGGSQGLKPITWDMYSFREAAAVIRDRGQQPKEPS